MPINSTQTKAMESPAMPLAGISSGRCDTAAEIASEWLEQHAEHAALTRRWQAVERQLIYEHNWFGLSEADRPALPEAEVLKAIEGRLTELFEGKRGLLCELPSVAASSAQGIILKLRVAAASVFPDENEEVHNLLRSILTDLQRLLAIKTDIPGE